MNYSDFVEGKIFDAYEYMGAHMVDGGVEFRVYAPRAYNVSLIGEFSDWQEIGMGREPGGFFRCFVENAIEGQQYKYKIYGANGVIDHCDPYGFQMQLRPESASIITKTDDYIFGDEKWMKAQKPYGHFDKPMNVYEIHLGSWKRNAELDCEDNWYNYREIADLLIPYLKEYGYNYVEMMPLAEHPADISWGYQTTGFFAPTSRYGKPDDLKYLIDMLHQNGIGVIMDYVPVHFARDSYGLSCFDGEPLYEYPNSDVGESEWGTKNFMHAHGDVRSFLNSAADYWVSKFHCDGIRMDAVSRIIYWNGDPNRDTNANGLEFLKTLNAGLHMRHPGVILIAEDSTNYPKVTVATEYDGLGFDYKWDLGWMNDTMAYMKCPPFARPNDYFKLSFSMMYFYNEHYMLPLSHDENVHGKATVVNKMWGDYEGKFPQARALYTYMLTHPGKKLNFMGNEIAQFREWDETREQDWDMLKYPFHDSFHEFMKKLNHIYLKTPALYKGDFNPDCFKWLVINVPTCSTYIYQRTSSDGKSNVIVAINMSDQFWQGFSFKVDGPMEAEEILNSDWDIYSGKCPADTRAQLKASKQGSDYMMSVDLAPFSAHIYEVKMGK